MEVSLASPPNLQHIYLKLLVTLIVNLLVVNKKKVWIAYFNAELLAGMHSAGHMIGQLDQGFPVALLYPTANAELIHKF